MSQREDCNFSLKSFYSKLILKVEAADVSFSDVRFQQVGVKFVQIVMTRAACSQQDWKLSLMEKMKDGNKNVSHITVDPRWKGKIIWIFLDTYDMSRIGNQPSWR